VEQSATKGELDCEVKARALLLKGGIKVNKSNRKSSAGSGTTRCMSDRLREGG